MKRRNRKNPPAKNPARPIIESKSSQKSAAREENFPIVGVGASAGGLEAFSKLLSRLPAQTGMAYVLVQHLDPTHESILPEILSRTTRIPVHEVKNKMVVQPDHVYVIPSNTNMSILRGALHLQSRSLTRGQHMPIDYFLHSLAEDQGEKAVGVILSGTASDGARGCEAIKAAGGITFAQDEKSAKFTGMPHGAIAAGCVDFVLPPEGIAAELARIGRHPYLQQPLEPQARAFPPVGGDDLNRIYTLLRNTTSVDFSEYKQSTLQRRIKRRMALHKLHRLTDYVDYLQGNAQELRDLYQDFLIHVTGFFRDPGAFKALKKKVFPSVVEKRKAEVPIRIWVAGCSTGEEVYSIAICLLEYLSEKTGNPPTHVLGHTPIQIFGSDIASERIAIARSGVYPESISADVSPERLRNFFVKVNQGYQICKPIREMCLFAEQNATNDPPFSRLDLISCRNLLIYLGPNLQKRLIPIFHFALKPNGFLMLGSSETVGGFGELFLLVDRSNKIYLKKNVATRSLPQFGGREHPVEKTEEEKESVNLRSDFAMEKEADQILLSKYVPATVVVSDNLEILQFRGHPGRYLEPAAGEATLNLAKMARKDLITDLRIAISRARKAAIPVTRENAGQSRDVNLEVVPIKGRLPQEKYFLVMFHDADASGVRGATKGKRGSGKARGAIEESEVEQLQQELAQTREHLQAIIEEQETTNEELKSANEEILSSNEELQSTNEELETAKEELQSGNEELTTLNEELQTRNYELSVANTDLTNLLSSVDIPIVMLTGDLRVRHFTPPAQEMLNLQPGDLGRRIVEIKPNINVPDFEELVRKTIDSVTVQEREIQDHQGRWHHMLIRPYKSADNKIDGAVVRLQDIDLLKRNLDRVRAHADTLVETAREPLLVLDKNLRVQIANRSFYETFRISPAETESHFIYDLGGGHLNVPELRSLLEEIIPSNTRVDDFEVEAEFAHIGRRMMLLNARRIEADAGGQLILLAIEDITERKRAEQEVRQLSARLLQLQDEERRHFARELHDSTGQKLAALAIALAVVEKEARGLTEAGRTALTDCSSLAGQVASEIRTVSYLLHPPLLEEAGLASAIRWYIDGITRRSGVQVRLEMSAEFGRLPAEIETVVFRIVQESLTNVQLHSGSKKARIELARQDQEVILEVSDEGRGFPRKGVHGVEGAGSALGVGIRGMRERVKQLGGRLEITSGKNGTAVRAVLPLAGEGGKQ